MMDSKRIRRLLALLLAACLLSFALAACGGGDDEDLAEEEDEGAATASAGTPYTSKGDEGTIAGVVNFTAAAPEPKPISMDADPNCAANNPNPQTEDVVVKDGKLENVFVYVRDGTTADGKKITGLRFNVPADKAHLDQKGCRYTPRVIGLMTGQTLSVTNSDPTAHNVHPIPQKNPEWNQSQPAGAQPIEKTFNRPETLIRVKCNQHPWMLSYVGVLAHPFFGVSREGGRFEIRGVPPGTYTLVAWHEKYPEKTASVTVGARESKTQDFTFDGAGASAELRGGSLRVLPAIEFPMAGKH